MSIYDEYLFFVETNGLSFITHTTLFKTFIEKKYNIDNSNKYDESNYGVQCLNNYNIIMLDDFH